MKQIVVFASGSGSNALNLIRHFNGGDTARVCAVFSNKKDAGVIQKATDNNVDVHVFDRKDFYDSRVVIEAVEEYGPDLIILAGFLWLVPPAFIAAFEGKIINLHPALLPKFGGKGMFGQHVHRAVLEAGETETGITVHLVNKEYDKGEIIYQDRFVIGPDASLESIEARIHQLEYKGLPLAAEIMLSR